MTARPACRRTPQRIGLTPPRPRARPTIGQRVVRARPQRGGPGRGHGRRPDRRLVSPPMLVPSEHGPHSSARCDQDQPGVRGLSGSTGGWSTARVSPDWCVTIWQARCEPAGGSTCPFYTLATSQISRLPMYSRQGASSSSSGSGAGPARRPTSPPADHRRPWPPMPSRPWWRRSTPCLRAPRRELRWGYAYRPGTAWTTRS